MLVHWAMPVFAKLVPKHILANLNEAFCNPHLDFNSEVENLPCYSGITGDLLFSSPTPGARRVSRRLLRSLLSQGVDIRWNKSVKELSHTDSGVRVEFEYWGDENHEVMKTNDVSWSDVANWVQEAERSSPELTTPLGSYRLLP